MRRALLTSLMAAILTTATVALGQTEPPPPPPSEPQSPPPSGSPGVLSDAASGTYEARRESLPSVNIYLPEGQASIRLRKLIRNVLFESQIDYEFVNGDISTFLRYKYYARNYTYRIAVFDAIEFPDLTSDDDQEFERVRGGLLLIGVPKDYNNRYFALLQNDRLTFGDVTRPDDKKNNIYVKLGYQYGTQFDERMNAIVGEQRGRITPVLTAFRDIGPQKMGLAAAVTQSAAVWTGDYDYTKLEIEGLRRFDLTSTSFVFSRLHLGTFLTRSEMENRDPRCDAFDDGTIIVDSDLDDDGTIEQDERFRAWQCYDVPQYELFRLGGREALKSISGNDSAVGTHEVHMTNELFVPIFRNRDYRIGPLHWNTLYGVGYVGVGTIGFLTDQIADSERLVVDTGIGTESAIRFNDWNVYLSVLYAHPVRRPEEGDERSSNDIDKGRGFRFSVRTVR
jgi:hypothetical protein